MRGWDEFELEVIRDRRDNVVIVCSIENLDPMGVHTGDSVTVAPQMTLSDEAYQELRDAAAAIVRAVGVETGGSNIQFARDRETGEHARDRDEPARLALLGARLEGDRLPDREGRRQARRRLHARRDPERPDEDDAGELRADARLRRRQVPALRLREVPRRRHDARDADEVGRRGDGDRPHVPGGVLEGVRLQPRARRGRGRRPGRRSTTCRTACIRGSGASSSELRDDGAAGTGARVYRRVDSCAGEVAADSNYYYSTRGEADEAAAVTGQAARRHPRLRPEPDRPGDRVRLLLRARRRRASARSATRR